MGADVDLCETDGSSALQIAVHEGKIEMVDILLRAGAGTHDLNCSWESQPVNLIDSATQNGYADIAELLLKAGAPKPTADQQCTNSGLGMLPAAAQNRVDILTELIHQGGDVNESLGNTSHTPFSLACNRGSSDAAMLLINAGVDLKSQGGFKLPALFYAAQAGFTDVIQLILEKGADINQLDFNGCTALLRMLDINQDIPVNLDQTRYDQTVWVVKRLISAGINVNVVTWTVTQH